MFGQPNPYIRRRSNNTIAPFRFKQIYEFLKIDVYDFSGVQASERSSTDPGSIISSTIPSASRSGRAAADPNLYVTFHTS